MAEVPAITITKILDDMGWSSVDFLKIDIEGGEKEIFKNNPGPWLDRVRNLAIELHGSEAEEIFYQAMNDYNFETFQAGELVICRKIARKVRTAV